LAQETLRDYFLLLQNQSVPRAPEEETQ